MPDDFYTATAQQRFAQIEADKAQALADLQQAKATGDSYQATDAVQRLADLDSAARNLASLHDQYLRSQNPPAPPPISREERAAKPLDRMDYDDALEIVKSGSKYGANLTHDDLRAGYAEVARRRARGE